MGSQEGLGGPQQQGAADHHHGLIRTMSSMICKLSDNRRDHETDAGGFQQKVERMGTDQGREAKSKVVHLFALAYF